METRAVVDAKGGAGLADAVTSLTAMVD